MATARQLEEERAHHRALDAMAGDCSARTVADESHLGCAYCAYLAGYYADQERNLAYSMKLKGIR